MGVIIKQARQAGGHTIRGLADLCGVYFTCISDAESGRRLNATTLSRLSAVLTLVPPQMKTSLIKTGRIPLVTKGSDMGHVSYAFIHRVGGSGQWAMMHVNTAGKVQPFIGTQRITEEIIRYIYADIKTPIACMLVSAPQGYKSFWDIRTF